ncbi:predicted protein [Sclerotinia sclerotiorum 1980 UF-70]|uniref:Uncharacterized protein n=1 Tax=Sclerotinia sclerotiorum (strain ATCC 18683 / 1980 / Ss-1) TaxID=665079 RepID=A7ETX3_SCLS1|nr:predicted protein [Sclerotinia sclerotiorum 1980 UF-70]EDN92915.1 predicted protein [Sclerotinia sclerotiorum 1980 UF-70]
MPLRRCGCTLEEFNFEVPIKVAFERISVLKSCCV